MCCRKKPIWPTRWSGLPDDEARAVLAGFMRWNGASGVPIGQRSSDEIVDRLLRKLRGGDNPDTVEWGLTLAARLAAIDGDPADAIPRARSIVVSAGGDTSAIDRLTELVNLVDDEPSLKGHLQIDFSLARGIAYYNGIIFDIVHGVGATNLGGGGRYDSLSPCPWRARHGSRPGVRMYPGIVAGGHAGRRRCHRKAAAGDRRSRRIGRIRSCNARRQRSPRSGGRCDP